jgi:tol-pal system protein YbgF
MLSGVRWTACVLSCLALIGCSGNDLIVKRQTEAEAKIDFLLQASKKSEQRQNELSTQQQNLDDQTKAAAQQAKQLQDIIQEQRIALEDLKARVTLLAQQAATPKVEVVNPEVAPIGKDTGPPPGYVKAFGLYSANNFPAAIEAFEAFLNNSPQSEFAPNSLYWIGECHYSLSSLDKAQAAFQKVVDVYPKSSKAPDALLKLGYTLLAKREKGKAKEVFESLINSYPSSGAAIKARERLTAN